MEENKQTDLEEVIQEVENEGAVDSAPETTEVDLSKFNSKDNDDVIKIDLSQPPQEQTSETEETTTEQVEEPEVAVVDENPEPEQVEEAQPQAEAQEADAGVLEEVTDDVVTEEEVMDALDEAELTGKPLPENVQKLLDFMEDTGGDINDYVRLNRSVEDIDDQDALREYYRKTKPHLSNDEIEFIMEDNFSYDEDVDDDRDIKRKKLARKEEVAEARSFLNEQKTKYYDEIKAGSKLTGEQQKAIDFFNRYNKESEATLKKAERQKSVFQDKTNKFFNESFKGFDYSVGDKTYRFKVNNADQVKNTQSDINNFLKKFLNEDDTMKDAGGYHKGLFTAMNADAIAQHFYEQGKADAVRDNAVKGKNITKSRQSHQEQQSGLKVRVLGDDSNSFKFKIKSKK